MGRPGGESGPKPGVQSGDLHDQIRRLEEALAEAQSRLEAKDGACSHTWQRLQSSQNEAISLKASLREKEAEIVRLHARCQVAEKRLERFEAASLSVLERAGGGGGDGIHFNSSWLPRSSPAPGVSTHAPVLAPHGGEGDGLFRRWGIDLNAGAAEPAVAGGGVALNSFKSAAQAAAEAEDMEAGVRALSAALGGGHTPELAPQPTPAPGVGTVAVVASVPGRTDVKVNDTLEEAVRGAVAEGLKGALESELKARDERIQELEQKLETGGWLSMTGTPGVLPSAAAGTSQAAGFSFAVPAQKPTPRPALQEQQQPVSLLQTPRTAFFASKRVPGSIKSGIEGSLSQMKRATSDFRQAKDTIRTAMKGLSSDILAVRRMN